MQLFGYFCSPRCKEKAGLQGMAVPQYAGQRDAAASRKWRRATLAVKLVAILVVGLVGLWIWYAWFGSRPRVAFKVRFENEPAMSGASAVAPDNQLVFIHGDQLARYDLKTGKEVWLRHLLDKQQIAMETEEALKAWQARVAESESPPRIPSLAELTRNAIRSAERSLQLRVCGSNIWVADGIKVRRFDWASGAPGQEVNFSGQFEDGVMRGNELEFAETTAQGRVNITRFNFVSGKIESTEAGANGGMNAGAAALNAALAGEESPKSKLGTIGGKTSQELGAAVAGGSMAGRLAAPATISVARNQQAALDVMDEMEGNQPGALEFHTRGGGNQGRVEPVALPAARTRVIPTTNGFVQLTTRLLERNVISRSAAKAPAKKSALDGTVSSAATADIANELLNEMSRNSGADMVREDHSKYAVTLHVGGGQDVKDWEGEVTGPPDLYPQSTVNVLIAGKYVFVFDLENKLKWQTTLNFPVAGGGTFLDPDQAEQSGLGPVVERDRTLFIYDQGVLSAFDLVTGNARWRLPSVGIAGMYFDDAGMIYLNTTTAGLDKIKYSRQIDVNDRTGDVVLKLDSRTGKELWKYADGGRIAYLSGKYIYTVSYVPPLDDDEAVDENMAALGLSTKPYLRLRRINPRTGRSMWDYYEPRGALDVVVHKNSFQIVLKKEVEVLKFLSL